MTQRGDPDVLKHIRKSLIKQGGIRDAYHDEDGYWVHLNDGWHLENYFSDHIVHEDTVSELKKVLSTKMGERHIFKDW